MAEFEVDYWPGEITATGVIGDFDRESYTIHTTGPIHKLALIPEGKEVKAGKSSIAYLNVQAKDERGLLSVNDKSEIEVRVEGPAVLLAAGNASPMHQGSFTDNSFNLFRGLGMVIIRSTGEPGDVTVTVSSEEKESTRHITFL